MPLVHPAMRWCRMAVYLRWTARSPGSLGDDQSLPALMLRPAGAQVVPQGTCTFLNVWTDGATFQHYYNVGQFSRLGDDVRGASIPFTSGALRPTGSLCMEACFAAALCAMAHARLACSLLRCTDCRGGRMVKAQMSSPHMSV